jgi:hypothetical protein
MRYGGNLDFWAKKKWGEIWPMVNVWWWKRLLRGFGLAGHPTDFPLNRWRQFAKTVSD